MLELSPLKLLPWTATLWQGLPGRVRTVTDTAAAQLGVVRRRAVPRWFRWLSRQSIEVLEAPDESLVFTLRRGPGWLASWQLLDAEERIVGTLRGRAVFDGFGYLLAVIEAPDHAGVGRFLSASGRILGSFEMQHDDTTVIFSQELEGNPFARMLLLGAVLIQEAAD
jgi:hypothetical protein